MSDRHGEVFQELFDSGSIMHWTKDEDDEMTVVFGSWDALKTMGDCIIADLGELLESSECVIPAGRCGAQVIMAAQVDQLDAIGVKLAEIFGVDAKRFDHDVMLDIFSVDEEGDSTTAYCKMDVDDFINKAGLEMGFSDTYDACCNCYKLIYTQPCSYGDHGRYRQTDDGVVCRDCDLKDPEGYLDEYLEDLHKGKIRGFELPIPKGWQKLGETTLFMGKPSFDAFKYERGLHIGQRDNPEKQYKAIKANTAVEDLLFDIDCGQFDVSWELVVRDEDYDKVYQYLTTADVDDLADKKGPGDFAKEALEGLSKQMLPPPEPGKIAITKIDTSDGTSKTRYVSPQDFIDGKGLKDG